MPKQDDVKFIIKTFRSGFTFKSLGLKKIRKQEKSFYSNNPLEDLVFIAVPLTNRMEKDRADKLLISSIGQVRRGLRYRQDPQHSFFIPSLIGNPVRFVNYSRGNNFGLEK